MNGCCRRAVSDILEARHEILTYEALATPRNERPLHQHLCFLEVDDPDGVQGGDRGDEDDANFEGEDALPGGAGDAANLVDEARLNPDFDYKPAWSVAEDEMDDVVHRTEETKRHLASKQKTGKQELLQTFMQDHRRAYAAVRTPRAPLRCSPLVHQCSALEAKGARERQEQLLKERKALDTGLEPQPAPSFRCLLPTEAQSRPLQTDELPRSPPRCRSGADRALWRLAQ